MQDEGYTTIQVGGHQRNSRRGVALVDGADADAVRGYRWSIDGVGYARRTIKVGGKQLSMLMHREILGLTHGDGVEVDHINGNKLDNRRENLRVATHAQNGQNLHHCGPHRGATWHAQRKCWQAQVTLGQKNRWLGYYATEEEAVAVVVAFRRQHMPYSRDARDAPVLPMP